MESQGIERDRNDVLRMNREFQLCNDEFIVNMNPGQSYSPSKAAFYSASNDQPMLIMDMQQPLIAENQETDRRTSTSAFDTLAA